MLKAALILAAGWPIVYVLLVLRDGQCANSLICTLATLPF